jgi:hypothetical protein
MRLDGVGGRRPINESSRAADRALLCFPGGARPSGRGRLSDRLLGKQQADFVLLGQRNWPARVESWFSAVSFAASRTVTAQPTLGVLA